MLSSLFSFFLVLYNYNFFVLSSYFYGGNHCYSFVKTERLNINFPTVMFHNINDIAYSNGLWYHLTYPTGKLEDLLFLLNKEDIKTLTFKDIKLMEMGCVVSPKKGLILTFDDGYESMYTNVLPLLKKYKAKAVFFVIYNELGKKGYLTREQLLELSKYGEIASHTLTHPDLRYISNNDKIKEILQSKYNLEKLTKTKIISFCYPAGKYNKKVIDIVKKYYNYARTTSANYLSPKRYEIGTLRIYPSMSVRKIVDLVKNYK